MEWARTCVGTRREVEGRGETCHDAGVCPLSALACGAGGTVVQLPENPRVARRLSALGIRPSIACHVLGRTPLGGPIHLRAGSVHLMLRTCEAAGVLVVPDGTPDPDDVLPAL
ncbi:MAG: FeoA domain-containing protein [Trueperaceae bacterium]|nr:FeoA domain-containing protein [Trueperaceae bacterium]